MNILTFVKNRKILVTFYFMLIGLELFSFPYCGTLGYYTHLLLT